MRWTKGLSKRSSSRKAEGNSSICELGQRVQSDPLIVERDLTSGDVKACFADIALELSVWLEVDCPTLAQAS